jgi:hypothetical protein
LDKHIAEFASKSTLNQFETFKKLDKLTEISENSNSHLSKIVGLLEITAKNTAAKYQPNKSGFKFTPKSSSLKSSFENTDPENEDLVENENKKQQITERELELERILKQKQSELDQIARKQAIEVENENKKQQITERELELERILKQKQSELEIVLVKSSTVAERERQMKTFGAVKTKSIAEVKGMQQDFVTVNKKVNYENFRDAFNDMFLKFIPAKYHNSEVNNLKKHEETEAAYKKILSSFTYN